jgi:hypothetical protein
MTADNEIDKKYNSANYFESLDSCKMFVSSYTPVIIKDLESVGLLEYNTLLGIGCFEPASMYEKLVIY